MSSGTKEIRGKGKLYPQTVSFFANSVTILQATPTTFLLSGP